MTYKPHKAHRYCFDSKAHWEMWLQYWNQYGGRNRQHTWKELHGESLNAVWWMHKRAYQVYPRYLRIQKKRDIELVASLIEEEKDNEGTGL